jgi:hypothetical protein
MHRKGKPRTIHREGRHSIKQYPRLHTIRNMYDEAASSKNNARGTQWPRKRPLERFNVLLSQYLFTRSYLLSCKTIRKPGCYGIMGCCHRHREIAAGFVPQQSRDQAFLHAASKMLVSCPHFCSNSYAAMTHGHTNFRVLGMTWL